MSFVARSVCAPGDAMAEENRGQPSLRDFNRYTDRNGEDFGQDNPGDLARPDELQRELDRDPEGGAETARVASDRSRIDSISGGSTGTLEATEAEIPARNLERVSDPALPSGSSPAGS